MRWVLLSSVLCAAPAMAAPCWAAAAHRHGIAADLLLAVARTESGLNPAAINRSHQARTGSYDIGLMQINSRHLPWLARQGIQETDLYDACVNLQVGAGLLADLFALHGVGWEAIGAYNAACTQLRGEACTQARAAYAWKVYRHLPAHAPQAAVVPTASQRSRDTLPMLTVRVAP